MDRSERISSAWTVTRFSPGRRAWVTEAYRAGGRVLVDLDKERLGGDNFITTCAWSPRKGCWS